MSLRSEIPTESGRLLLYMVGTLQNVEIWPLPFTLSHHKKMLSVPLY